MGPFPCLTLLLDPSHHTSGCERRSASCLEPCGLMDRGAGTDAALRLPLRLRAPALPAPLEPNLRLRADPMVGVATRPASWPCVARDAACGERICMRCIQLFVSSTRQKSVNPRPSTDPRPHRQTTELRACSEHRTGAIFARVLCREP